MIGTSRETNRSGALGRVGVAIATASVALLAASGTVAASAAPANLPANPPASKIPQLSAAHPGTLEQCSALAAGFTFASTTVTSAEPVAAGVLTNAGAPVGAHCLVKGHMNQRVSPVDGQTYAIGFEMRLPNDWSGRFLYQANGGTDGRIAPATGVITGGQLENGLQLGFAVMSSDAGHNGAQNPLFGLDPQARLDYGYQAVGTLTPMAKALVAAAYGRGPDRSYIAGGSNGGRHTMVASARYADQYDGFLAVAPGFNLPKAAVAQLWGAQQWATVATSTPVTGPADLETAFPAAERRLLAEAILARCDGLDRLKDGIVQDVAGCQSAFSISRDVPTCVAERNGACLTAQQKAVISAVFAGARNSAGEELYSSFPLDPGVVSPGWANWKFTSSIDANRDPVAVGFIFSSPPADVSMLEDTVGYALNYDVDTQAPLIHATDGIYTESAMSFMTPPNPTQLDTLRNRGAKMIVVHGTADGVFSPNDTASWYQDLDKRYKNKAGEFARYFEVPGMGHVRGGPSTDQFDGLTALVDWVERGEAPDRIVATARGIGNPGGVNTEVPASWSPDRSRPLCVYPGVATFAKGDSERAESFVCKTNYGRNGKNS